MSTAHNRFGFRVTGWAALTLGAALLAFVGCAADGSDGPAVGGGSAGSRSDSGTPLVPNGVSNAFYDRIQAALPDSAPLNPSSNPVTPATVEPPVAVGSGASCLPGLDKIEALAVRCGLDRSGITDISCAGVPEPVLRLASTLIGCFVGCLDGVSCSQLQQADSDESGPTAACFARCLGEDIELPGTGGSPGAGGNNGNGKPTCSEKLIECGQASAVTQCGDACVADCVVKASCPEITDAVANLTGPLAECASGCPR